MADDADAAHMIPSEDVDDPELQTLTDNPTPDPQGAEMENEQGNKINDPAEARISDARRRSSMAAVVAATVETAGENNGRRRRGRTKIQ